MPLLEIQQMSRPDVLRRGFLLLVLLAGLAMRSSAGHTWQVYPAYLAVLVTILVLVLRKEGKIRILGGTALLLLIGLSALALHLFPLVRLPEPSGGFRVGVRYQTVQTDRDETMTPDPGDTRKLYLKIWYPAEEGTRRASYIEGGEETIDFLLGRFKLPIPAFLFHHVARTRTHGYLDAPVAQGVFPLVTFSHGHGTLWQSQNTSLMEELASRGIVVVAIAHSHQTIFAAESDRSIVTFERIVPLTGGKIDAARSKELERRRDTARSKPEMDAFVRDNISGDESANAFVAVWSADISSAVDALLVDNSDPKSVLYQKLDPDRIGAAGMSFGGAAAVESTVNDPRITAAVNMDGMQFGNLINTRTRAKLLFLEAKKYRHDLSKYGPFSDSSIDQVSSLLFEGAKHTNFSDISLVSPLLASLGFLGEIDGEFMVEQMNRIVPAFFDAAFDGEPFRADRYLIPGKIVSPAS